jgi:hypothetical protein
LKVTRGAWWKDLGKNIQPASFEAIKPESRAHVSVHLAAVASFMLTTHKCSLEKGC